MTIALRSISTYNGSPSPATTISLTAPTGIQEGDILVLQGVRYGAAATPLVPPAGFTEVEAQWTDGSYVRAGLWYRVASGESGPYTCGGGSANQCWGMAAFSGAAWAGISSATETPDYTIPTVTSLVDNCLWLGMISAGVDARTFTWPVGWTEVWDIEFGTTSHAHVAITLATQALPTAGATGTATVTPSTAANTYDRDYSLILKPIFLPSWIMPQAVNVLLDEGAD
jgi:hypothetical protein